MRSQTRPSRSWQAPRGAATGAAATCSTRARSSRSASTRASRSTSSARLRNSRWVRADALQDRRVEITGPTSRKMVINALNSGARGFMADFEDSNSPTWRNVIEGQINLTDAIRGGIEHDEKGKHYELGEDPAVLHVRPRGLHLPGSPPPDRRSSGRRSVHGLRPLRASQRRGAARARLGPVPLHPEARVAPRGRAVARRLPHRRGGARPRPGHDQGDRPDRDDPGGVLHGRDPVRAARPRRRPQRRPLGLHLLCDQALPVAAGVRHARPLRRHDDRAVHARVQRPSW